MKKNFKKFIATTLATVSITGVSSAQIITNAENPNPPAIFTANTPYPYTDEEVIKRIDYKIKEFESLAPDVFFVHPSFKDPSKNDIRMALQIITQMTEVFKKFPRFRNMFIEQIKATTENKKFELVPLDSEVDHMSSDLCLDGKYIPSNAVYYATDAIRIHVNPDQFRYISSNPDVHSFYKENFVMFNDDYTATGITHELGHLFSYVIIWRKDPAQFSKFVNSTKNMFAMWKAEPNLFKNISLLRRRTESQEMTSTSIEIAELQRQISQEILELANKKYDFLGVAHISSYGDHKPNEWLAEVFADAVCAQKPSALGMAMLEYLNTFE